MGKLKTEQDKNLRGKIGQRAFWGTAVFEKCAAVKTGHTDKQQHHGKAQQSGGQKKHPIPAQKKIKGPAETAGNLS